MLSEHTLRSVLPNLPTEIRTGAWFRNVDLDPVVNVPNYSPLNMAYTAKAARRFKPVGIQALYLASKRELAVYERRLALQHHLGTISVPYPPDVTFTIEFTLQHVLVLDDQMQTQLSTHPQELRGPWDAPNAPTQILGQCAYDCGVIEGILYPSAVAMNSTEWNLMIFTDRLRRRSFVKCDGIGGTKYAANLPGSL